MVAWFWKKNLISCKNACQRVLVGKRNASEVVTELIVQRFKTLKIK